MPKQFYSDKDIEELHRNGIQSLRVTDAVVLTDLAYEKARLLGLQLIFDGADGPPAAPVRPYLSEVKPPRTQPKVDPVSSVLSQPPPTLTPNPSPRQSLPQRPQGTRGAELEKRIREKVAAQLGSQIDPQLLDSILKRTLKVLGVK